MKKSFFFQKIFMVIYFAVLGSPAMAEFHFIENTRPQEEFKNNLTQFPDPKTSINLKSLSLREAILIALRYNPNIKNSEFQRILQRFDLENIEGDFDWKYTLAANATVNRSKTDGALSNTTHSYTMTPQASFDTRFGTNFSVSADQSKSDVGYTPSVTFSMTQPIIKGLGRDVKMASYLNKYDQEEINKLSLKNSIATIINTISNDYFSLLQSENNLITQENSLKSSIRTIQENKVRIRAGKLAPNENIQQEAQLASTELSVSSSKQEIFNQKQTLLKDMGLPPDVDLEIIKKIDTDGVNIQSLDKSVQAALTNSTDYLQKVIQMREDKRNLLVAENNQKWTLDLKATSKIGGGRGIKTYSDGQNRNHSVSLDLSVPIDDSDLERAVLSAKLTVQQDELSLMEAKRSLILDIGKVLNSIKNKKEEIQQSIKSVQLAKTSLDLEIKKEQLGLSNALNVTSLRTQYVTAQLSETSTRIAYLIAVNDYYQKIGLLLNFWGIEVRY